ncbi:hypothetical protein LH935_28520 (plasmid) [Gordonia polyisoprenivorans]|uniref:hypothetical protein n=1 Tax=Gordonia polyisoprenivorans TaxID=84595 RepID=UPI00223472DE|nr:hypothetical protein LH935_28520 [Gordonia polyisoprenivorans]
MADSSDTGVSRAQAVQFVVELERYADQLVADAEGAEWNVVSKARRQLQETREQIQRLQRIFSL